MMNLVQHELRCAGSRLARSRYYAVSAIACLALGATISTIVFGIVNAYLLRPLPFKGGERMVMLGAERPGRRALTNLSYPNYNDIHERSTVFDGLVSYAPVYVALSVNNLSDRVWGQAISGTYFEVLGVSARAGRTIVPADDVAAAPPVVVISHGLWQRRFGSDQAILGSPIRLNESVFTVIGVMGEGFRGTDSMLYADFWVPSTSSELVGGPALRARGGNNVRVLGRLPPGATLLRAQAEADALAAVLREQYPDENRGFGLRVIRETSARPDVSASGQTVPVAVFLMLVAGAILAICGANVVSLTLARATARHTETAIQLALGASRWTIQRQYLLETLLISLAGGIVAFGLAAWVTMWLSSMPLPQDLPLYLDFRPDGRVAAFCLLMSVAAGAIIGAIVSIKASRAPLSTALNESRVSHGRRRTRLQSSIVIGQYAMLSLLLVLCALLVRSVIAASRMDLGFRSEQTVLLTFDPAEGGYDEARGPLFANQLTAAIRRLPGVRTVSMADNVPFGPSSASMPVQADDRIAEPPVSASYSVVNPDYFSVLGIPLLRGRVFEARDTAGAPPVVVVNERLAHTLWPSGDPLFRTLAVRSTDGRVQRYQVIGVVKTGKYHSINEAPREYLYLPYAQAYRSRMTLLVQTDLPLPAILPGARAALGELDSHLSFFDVTTLETRVQSAKGAVTLGALLASGLGVIGALLAGLGLYGLMSYAVTLRARELAIRLGLGAPPRAVTLLCLRRGVMLAAVGTGAGLLLGALLVKPFESMLVGVRGIDWSTSVTVTGVILAIALVASWIPVRHLFSARPLGVLLRD